MHRLLISLLPAVLLPFATLCKAESVNPQATANTCRINIDAAVARFGNQDMHGAQSLLQSSLSTCSDYPHIAHNLGVLAGESDQWDQAIEYFRSSLAQDARAANTLNHLQAIYQYRAALAYSQALSSGKKIARPVLKMQDSSLHNTEYTRKIHKPPQSDQHSRSTVEYELYDWWQTNESNNREGWLAHYTEGYPPPPRDRSYLPWDAVQREIAFIGNEAIAMLRHKENNKTISTLLLMRLQGSRWKIYQETRL